MSKASTEPVTTTERLTNDDPSPPPRPSPARTSARHINRGVTRLTAPEARLLQAWRLLRDHSAWQPPSVSELAHVLCRSTSQVRRTLDRLRSRGLVVLAPGEGGVRRRYQLTTECAAQPHLTELLAIATEIVRLQPRDVVQSARTAGTCVAYDALWARARGVLQDVAMTARVPLNPPRAQPSADVACESLDRARAAAQLPPSSPEGPASPTAPE